MFLDGKSKWKPQKEGNADRITPRGKVLDCLLITGKHYKSSDLSKSFSLFVANPSRISQQKNIFITVGEVCMNLFSKTLKN